MTSSTPAPLNSGTAVIAVSEPSGPISAVICGSLSASRSGTAASTAPSSPPGLPSSIAMKLIAYSPALPPASNSASFWPSTMSFGVPTPGCGSSE